MRFQPIISEAGLLRYQESESWGEFTYNWSLQDKDLILNLYGIKRLLLGLRLTPLAVRLVSAGTISFFCYMGSHLLQPDLLLLVFLLLKELRTLAGLRREMEPQRERFEDGEELFHLTPPESRF